MTTPAPVVVGGYISGAGGTVPVLGLSFVNITSNADITLTLNQADPSDITVSSDGASTAVRKVIVPLIAGKTWVFTNATSEGYSINVIGSSGAGVLVAPSASIHVRTDGTNVYQVGTSNNNLTSSPLTVTYWPGGVAQGTTFTLWSELLTYVTAAITSGYQGLVVYQFDDSLASITVSGAIPGNAMRWVGIGSGYLGTANATVTIQSGTTFPGISSATVTCSFELQSITILNKAANLATISGPTRAISFVLDIFAIWFNQSSGSAGFNIALGALCYVYVLNNSSVTASPHPPMIQLDTGHSSQLICSCNINGNVGTNAFGGTAGINVSLISGSAIGAQSTYGSAYSVQAALDCTVNPIAGGTVTYRPITLQNVTVTNPTYAVGSSDCVIYCNRAGTVSITLPAPAFGKYVVVKDISGAAGINNITVHPHGAETIDGASSYVISANYDKVRLSSDGTSWWEL